MRACLVPQYGGPEVLEFRDVPTPQPKPDEVLVRVRACTVTSGDARIRGLNVPYGFKLLMRLALGVRGPRQPILGSELAGDVVAIGSSVMNFQVGDAVMAMSGKMGAQAGFVALPASSAITLKPTIISYAEAAAIPFGGLTMLDFYERAELKRGERVLVNGASGAVGLAAVQLARIAGADVTAVCSAANTSLVLEHGATRTIDYTREDLAKGSERYDVVVDTVGTAPYERVRSVLTSRGRVLLVLATLPQILRSVWTTLRGPHRVIAGPSSERPDHLRKLADLTAAGSYKAVIGRRFTFDEIADAHRYVETGRKIGAAVVELGAD
jgi:NADPH:quinone reductase-like Zn-dependent oxidoreductase